MDRPDGQFRIRWLDRLRASETIDDAWSSISNDEFFALGMYMRAATGVGLEGYGGQETSDAVERLLSTLDELEVVVDVLNAAPELGELAARSEGANDRDANAIIGRVGGMIEGRVSPALAERVMLELRMWMARLDEPGLSALLEYVSTAPDETEPPQPPSGSAVETSGQIDLRPGARELVEIAGRIADARGADRIEPIDVLLAAVYRPSHTRLDPGELERGSVHAIVRIVATDREVLSERVTEALRSIAADPSSIESPTDSTRGIELATGYLGPDGGVAAAVDLARRVTASGVYSHHVVAVVLGDPLPTAPLDALGVTWEQLCVALRRGVDERWSQSENVVEWDRVLGTVVRPDEFSGTVRQVRTQLGPDFVVPAARIVAALQPSKGSYGRGLFGSVQLDTDGEPRRPVDGWLRAVRSMYDVPALSSTRHAVIDGELLVAALAALDPGLRAGLESSGFLPALLAEIEVGPGAPTDDRFGPPTSGLRGQLLAGASADTVPEPGDGRVRAADRLGTAADVEMIVSVLLARDTPLPLALALFGDWGSGKSFFMALMQERMEELSQLATEGRPEAAPFCRRVRAVRFNAWHYVDTDLWASLAATLFDELANDGRPGEAAKKLTELDQAATALEVARAARVKAESKLDDLRNEVPTTRVSVESAISAVSTNKELRSTLEKGARGAEEFVAAVGAVETFAQKCRAMWQLARDELFHRRRWPTLVTLVVLVVAVALLWAGRDLSAAKKLLSLCVVLVGALTPAVEGATRLLHLARNSRLAREAPLLRQEDEVARLADDERRKQSKVDELDAELVALRNTGDRLREFVRARASSGDYRGRLGVISQLRRDFEQLVAMLPVAGKPGASDVAAAAAAITQQLPDVERIVLYIDDLDRCPHDKVVEVLQAVHLLLAFKLFVVVVGVDSNWLERSLVAHYKTLLEEPDDYLEKIFQISFALRRMTSDQFTELVDALAPTKPAIVNGVEHGAGQTSDSPGAREKVDAGGAATHRDGSGQRPETTSPPADASSHDPGGVDGQADPAASTSADAEPSRPALPKPEALEITDEERRLLGRLAGIVPTPRAVKRLMNTYRMLRVSVPDDEFERFQPNRGDEYQAVVLLLSLLVGEPKIAARVFPALIAAEPEADLWSVLGEDADAVRVLAALRPHITVTRCEPYRRWAPRVARFSFRLAPNA